MKRFFYVLSTPVYSYPEDHVDARNKTEARKIIGESHRANTPSQAKRSGFYAFHDCSIQWIREVDLDDESSEHSLDNEISFVDSYAPEHSDDPRVGVLIREGKPVYYGYLSGDYQNGYFEGDRASVEAALVAAETDQITSTSL
ncbi:hypothetical protein ACI2KR_31710 [Pseudomonas luteola]